MDRPGDGHWRAGIDLQFHVVKDGELKERNGGDVDILQESASDVKRPIGLANVRNDPKTAGPAAESLVLRAEYPECGRWNIIDRGAGTISLDIHKRVAAPGGVLIRGWDHLPIRV